MAASRISHSDLVLSTVQSPQAAAVSAVAASWCRSALRHGLDPAGARRHERFGAREMAEARHANAELIEVATPILDRLYGSVGPTGCCVVITDLAGAILETRAPQAEAALFDAIGLAPGALWSEQAEGTNGIGTCLVEARPLVIHRHEHFASRNIGVSCMDAPIFDAEGRLAGALDVSTARADHGEAMAGLVAALVQDAARAIERDLFCRRYAGARIVVAGTEPGTAGGALLAVDRDDLVIGATRLARQRFRLGQASRVEPRPLGDLLGAEAPVRFEDRERTVLRQALARSGGNVAAAARLLGIGRATMYRRMEKVGMAGAEASRG